MDGDPLQQAPVVLVVVTRDDGPDLAEVLAAAAAQDHPNVRTVVIAGTARPDLAAVVGASLPGAVVRAAPDAAWFAALADQVLRLVEGDPAFFCFVRDGVALAPDAISALVRESYRSNAGVAGPKLVAWDQPDRLVSVGHVVDKFGERAPIALPGELDQEQHDAVRDVFALDGACLLVRGDLLRSLDGFDPTLDGVGEDLDLCWRAHVAGARVLVVPDAVARYRVPAADPGDDDRRERNRLRTVLGNYSAAHLLRVVPQMLVVSALQIVVRLAAGRVRRARALAVAWVDVLVHPGAVAARRRALAARRVVPDGDVRRLQARGSAALLRLIRRVGSDDDASGRFVGVRTAGRQVATGVRRAERTSVVAVAVLLLVTVVGGRSLLSSGVPTVGELVPLPGSARDALRAYLSGWWDIGLGRSAPVPSGVGVLGVLGLGTFGHMALLRTLLVLVPLVLGPWGAWRLVRPFRSQLARVAALVAYAGVPLGVNAVATGRLGGLVVWAATPWVVARLARIGGQAPFVARNGVLPAAAGLALVVALVAALAPAFVLVPPLCAAGLLLGSLVAGELRAAVRAVVVGVAATAIGAVLLLPWPLVAGGRPGYGFGRATLHAADGWSPWALLRFAVGPHGRIGLAALAGVAALVGLALARGDRSGWAVRGVVLAATGIVGAWLASRGSLGDRPPTPEVFLAPAATGLALAIAAGAAELDLAVRGARLSWRQPAGFALGLLVLVAAVPSLGAHLGGRFDLPAADLVRTLRLLPLPPEGAEQRVLWVGRPDALPGGGWPLGGGLAYTVTGGDGPTVSGRWDAAPGAAERDLGDALLLAADGQTDRLGHLLGPAGVRFVIVDTEVPPAQPVGEDDAGVALDPTLVDRPVDVATGEEIRQPASLLAALAGQLDLRRTAFERDQRLVVYENASWIPVRAQLPPAAASASKQAGAAALVQAELEGSTPVLPAVRTDRAEGTVEVGTVYAAVPLDERWTLRTAGRAVLAEPAFGWASAYPVDTAGPATLAYDTSPLRRLAVAVQALAWLVVAGLALPRRAVAGAEADDVLVDAHRRARPSPWGDDDLDRVAAPEPVPAASAQGSGDLTWGDGADWADEAVWADEEPR